MERINMFNECGELIGWFDGEKAEQFGEDIFWANGWISVATGSQLEHETLYYTAGKRWVLYHWSQWPGGEEWHKFISDQQAREWLLKNGHHQAAGRHFGEIEEKRGPGRPEIGPAIQIRLPESLLTRLDEEAGKAGTSRAETIRRILAAALA